MGETSQSLGYRHSEQGVYEINAQYPIYTKAIKALADSRTIDLKIPGTNWSLYYRPGGVTTDDLKEQALGLSVAGVAVPDDAALKRYEELLSGFVPKDPPFQRGLGEEMLGERHKNIVHNTNEGRPNALTFEILEDESNAYATAQKAQADRLIAQGESNAKTEAAALAATENTAPPPLN